MPRSNPTTENLPLKDSDPGATETDLIIAWVAPIGTELDGPTSHLETILKERFGFTTQTVRVANAILKALGPTHVKRKGTDSDDYYTRTFARQSAGNWLRKVVAPSFLAAVAVRAISEYRKDNRQESRATIIRSLKHPEEAILLRRVYGPAFILIGVHCTYAERLAFLRGKCNGSADDARELIRRDEAEKDDCGQQTRDLFALCDAYIQYPSDFKQEINRFFDLLFGRLSIVPRAEEYGMAAAFQAAEQSGDLARQVGAAIFNSTGEVIATGRNDVPKAGGGVYRVGESPDASDYAIQFDPGQRYRERLMDDVADEISKGIFGVYGKIEEAHRAAQAESTTNGDPSMAGRAVNRRMWRRSKRLRLGLRQTRLKDIVEFGRSLHAEMDAVTTCARRGISTQDSTLYVTTFPCHTCTRHIIASGVGRVVYLEPYPKSQAILLHIDSIECDALDCEPLRKGTGEVLRIPQNGRRVKFDPFTGVAPRRYRGLFSLHTVEGRKIERKDEFGRALEYPSVKDEDVPKFRLKMPAQNHGLLAREKEAGQVLLAEHGHRV